MKGKFAIILNPASTLATPEIDIYEKIMPLTSIPNHPHSCQTLTSTIIHKRDTEYFQKLLLPIHQPENLFHVQPFQDISREKTDAK
jgi:hypothetical protein